ATQRLGRQDHAPEQVQRDRIHGTLGMTASAQTPEFPATPVIHQCLCNDAAGGVSRVSQKHVVRAVGHGADVLAFNTLAMQVAGAGQSVRTCSLCCISGGASLRSITWYRCCEKKLFAVSVRRTS